jgi:hypothetical protein
MNHDHLQYHREKTGALQSILLLSNVQLLVYRSYVDTGRRYFLSLKTAFSRFMYAYAVFIKVPLCMYLRLRTFELPEASYGALSINMHGHGVHRLHTVCSLELRLQLPYVQCIHSRL